MSKAGMKTENLGETEPERLEARIAELTEAHRNSINLFLRHAFARQHWLPRGRGS